MLMCGLADPRMKIEIEVYARRLPLAARTPSPREQGRHARGGGAICLDPGPPLLLRGNLHPERLVERPTRCIRMTEQHFLLNTGRIQREPERPKRPRLHDEPPPDPIRTNNHADCRDHR